jgi:tetratricopeptide (TPR) repeat protein
MLGSVIARLLGARKLAPGAAPSSDDEAARLRDLAIAALAQGRATEAAATLERAVALGPNRAELHVALADALFRAGAFERAEAAYSTALTLAPGFPTALHAQWGAATARAWREPNEVSPEAAAPDERPYNDLVSIVICSNNPDKFAKVVANFQQGLGAVRHEIIGVHDARSLCEGYNRGVTRSRGEIVVFAHDDIRIVSPDFAAKLASSLGACDLFGVAGTTRLDGANWAQSGWPYLAGQVGHPQPDRRRVVTAFGLQDRLVLGAQALDGLFFAVRRSVLERVRFDDTTFDGWHFYDIDFTYSAFLAGLRVGIRTDLLLWHESLGRFDESWQQYAARFVRKHQSTLASSVDANAPGSAGFGIEVASDEEWIAVTRHLFR